jgi:tetratricopeptide (TPR) repeat protein
MSRSDDRWIEEVEPAREDRAIAAELERTERRAAAAPDEWPHQMELARLLVQTGETRRAITVLRRLLEAVHQTPVLAAVFFNLGSCYEAEQRWREAAGAFQQCVDLMPGMFWARYQLALACSRTGRMEEAAYHLRRAIALRPDFADAYHALALVCATMGNVRAAEWATRDGTEAELCWRAEHESVWTGTVVN